MKTERSFKANCRHSCRTIIIIIFAFAHLLFSLLIADMGNIKSMSLIFVCSCCSLLLLLFCRYIDHWSSHRIKTSRNRIAFLIVGSCRIENVLLSTHQSASLLPTDRIGDEIYEKLQTRKSNRLDHHFTGMFIRRFQFKQQRCKCKTIHTSDEQTKARWNISSIDSVFRRFCSNQIRVNCWLWMGN